MAERSVKDGEIVGYTTGGFPVVSRDIRKELAAQDGIALEHTALSDDERGRRSNMISHYFGKRRIEQRG